MRDDRDFTAYATARWTQLVRTLVTLGAPLDAAHRTATEALSRCHDEWSAREEWVDLDVHVFSVLMDRWRRDRSAWWERPVRETHEEAVREAGWPELEPELDRLSVPAREGLVLRVVGALTQRQVEEVIPGDAVGPDGGALDAELIRVAELIPVDPPRLDAMIGRSDRRRRLRRAASVGAVLVLVAGAGVLTLLTVRDDPSEREAFGPVRRLPFSTPAPVAWHANGSLHLPHSLLVLPDVRAFAMLGDDGAIYLDLRGNLVEVTGDGERELIDTIGADSTFAASDPARKVVWVDTDGPELVVRDLDTGTDVVRRTLDDEQARIIAVDGGWAYLAAGGMELEVDLHDGRVRATPSEGLLDVAGGARAIRASESAFVVRRGEEELRLKGTDAQLDPSGRFALAWVGGGPGQGELRLYDTYRDRRVDLAVVDPSTVAAAGFGLDGSVIAMVEPRDSRIVEVRLCQDLERACPMISIFPTGGAGAVLPQ